MSNDPFYSMVLEMHDDGFDPKEISEETGLDNKEIIEIIARSRGLKAPKNGVLPREAHEPPGWAQKVITDYLEEMMRVSDILKKYDFSSYNVFYTFLRRHEIPVRQRSRVHVQAKIDQLNNAVKMYQEGHRIVDIVDETGINQPRLHKELRDRGIKFRNKTRN